ncbi:Dihydrodipicolinate reductase [Candidatus Tremblaya phenacola PAVE]|nr:Dihydrodipicolinate reductase [Candidatus Tremblaya phenacola PAVE]
MNKMIVSVLSKRNNLTPPHQTAHLTASRTVYGSQFQRPNIRTFLVDELAVINSDCVVDFSIPRGTFFYLKLLLKWGVGVVVSTTGFFSQERAFLKDASKMISILISTNTSFGVNKFSDIISFASFLFFGAYDITILETHHKNKLDAPSGTALSLGNRIASNRPAPLPSELASGSHRISFSSIRGANIIGRHEIMFFSNNETITLSHSSSNRLHYAEGAIKAASHLIRKPKGLFSMEEIIDDRT